MSRITALLIVALMPVFSPAENFSFDGGISEPVLRSYLSRSITCLDLLTEKGCFEDNLRMLEHTGVKFAGRTIYLWGHESDFPRRLALAQTNAARVHNVDPQIVLQACVFEIVTRQVEQLPVPAWVFQALGLPVEERNFRYEAMLYTDGRFHNHWKKDASVPDISQTETQLWLYYLAASYINAGIEAIHWGQAELMNRNDPDLTRWDRILSLTRKYAAEHARRRWVLCDAHLPSGGLLRGGRLLFDFHSFPLRIKEVPDRPQHGVLEDGFKDSIYGRSRGGVVPSGWRCDHLPYLVEFDNYGVSSRPGQSGVGSHWVWGYDEISWFARQDRAYRNDWLRYAWAWVRKHDSAGYLQMPGSRCLQYPVQGKSWYFANMPSSAVPDGFGQEETIRSIWSGNAVLSK